MDDPFSQLPKAAVLVYAGVLTAAASNKALASQTEAALVTWETSEQPQVAPTCGPMCHDPNYQEPPPLEPDPVAPTCGPSCHGGGGGGQGEEAPPPVPEKQGGCALAPEPEQTNLALLGLGLSLGAGLSIAARRRTRE